MNDCSNDIFELLSCENFNQDFDVLDDQGNQVDITDLIIVAQIDTGADMIAGVVTKSTEHNYKFNVFFSKTSLNSLENKTYVINIFINNSDNKRYNRIKSKFNYVSTNLDGIATTV